MKFFLGLTRNYMAVAALAVFLSCVSCSKKETTVAPAATGEVKPSITSMPLSIHLSPEPAYRNTTLRLNSMGFYLIDGKIEWTIDGLAVPGQTGEILKLDNLHKGSIVQAKVTVRGQTILSNPVRISNSVPEITKAKIMPEGAFNPGDKLGVDASASDLDGDNVVIQYSWTKNGVSAGTDSKIDAELKRGDKAAVTLTPYDGEGYGRPLTLTREILNFSPVIKENTKHNFDGDVLSYQVQATDPDGDTLKYSLKDAPQGMKINPSTGLVTWDVPQDFIGKASFTVVADDEHGGQATYKLTVTINPPTRNK